MTYPELEKALRRLKVETGSLTCMGCRHEHNCSVQGCAILRESEQLASIMSKNFNKDALLVMTAQVLNTTVDQLLIAAKTRKENDNDCNAICQADGSVRSVP